MRRKLTRFFILVFLLLLGIQIFYVWVQHDVEQEVGRYIYRDSAFVPANKVGLVLGAQILPGHVPSQALANRLDAAVALYKAKKVQHLLMSGDGRSPYYDEVTTMKEYAIKQGVSSADIVDDQEGLRTFDSCERAKDQFGLQKMTVITQYSHALRAVYTCRNLGIDALGLAAPEYTENQYFSADYWRIVGREEAALLLAWFEIKINHSHAP